MILTFTFPRLALRLRVKFTGQSPRGALARRCDCHHATFDFWMLITSATLYAQIHQQLLIRHLNSPSRARHQCRIIYGLRRHSNGLPVSRTPVPKKVDRSVFPNPKPSAFPVSPADGPTQTPMSKGKPGVRDLMEAREGSDHKAVRTILASMDNVYDKGRVSKTTGSKERKWYKELKKRWNSTDANENVS